MTQDPAPVSPQPEPQPPPLERIVWELTPAEAQLMLNALQQFTAPLQSKVMGQAQAQFRKHEEDFKKQLAEEAKKSADATKEAVDSITKKPSGLKAVPK